MRGKSNRTTKPFLFWLVTFFMVIILILSAFQTVVLRISLNNIEREVVDSYKGKLNYISDRFYETIAQVERTLFVILSAKDLQPFVDDGNPNPVEIWQAYLNVLADAPRRIQYLHTVIAFRRNNDLIITSTGSNTKQTFFEKFFHSETVTLERLESPFDRSVFEILPCTEFKHYIFNDVNSRNLLPIVFRPGNKKDFIICGLVTIQDLFADMTFDDEGSLTVLYYDQPIYKSDPTSVLPQQILTGSDHHVVIKDSYYFRLNHPDSRFSYVASINKGSIHSASNRIIIVYIIMTFLSLAMAVLFVLYFSGKLVSPLKQLQTIVNSKELHSDFRSHVNELRGIHQGISHIILENLVHSSELDSKDSLLTKYFYQDRLKNIYTDINEIELNLSERRNFSLLYLLIHYKPLFYEYFGEENNSGIHLISEYTQKIISRQTGDQPIAFQVEHNQIVCIIQDVNDAKKQLIVDSIIDSLKNESDFLYLTVIIGSTYEEETALSGAYREVLQIAQMQRPSKAVQLLNPDALSRTGTKRFFITDEQINTFRNNITNGCEEENYLLVDQLLEYNDKKQVVLFYFRRLASMLIDVCVSALSDVSPDLPGKIDVRAIDARIQRTYTLETFQQILYDLVRNSASLVNASKLSNDPIINYTLKYIEENYSKDIYLDLLSENLNISSSYLSQYFKNKTGVNFLAYLSNVRLEKAKSMLELTQDSVNSISRAVGYINTNSFIRAFKKYYGMTPGEMRRSSQRPD